MTNDQIRRLALDDDVISLTGALVDIPSESGEEQVIADAVHSALDPLPHLAVERVGNNIVARTMHGRADRVVIGGHLDTVPAAGNLPCRREGGFLHGLGTCDMKGGIAVALRLAATVRESSRDITYLFYECEEVTAQRNGLLRLSRDRPDLLAGDFAILMEPSNARVEAGCQGTLRAEIAISGVRSHSARSWMGENAVHQAVEVLDRLRSYEPRRVMVDGLEYREGLNAVGISGGIAGNVIPDECVVVVNYRFAPTLTVDEAIEHVAEVFAGFPLEIVDQAPGALPGLQLAAARDFVTAVGGEPHPKFGWTDVARFTELGIPAVNYGPGDPAVAHATDERVSEADLLACEVKLRRWLMG